VQHTVHTPDGRVLAVEEAGDPAGRPVLVHGGMPNSRRLYSPHASDAAGRGLRLISYDRPGYGGSSPLSSGAPFDADGLNYFAGMGQGNVDDIRLFLADKAAARAKAEQDREEFLAASPDDIATGMATLLTPTDAAVLTGELAKFLTSSMQDGLAPGAQGWWDDNCIILPWGFDLADISVPVLLLHGRQDMFVPFGHGSWLAAHIPGVEARLTDDDGHLTLFQYRVPDVHAWLDERLS
jgi:pimeloyl-ACP methyl ester carboxylesterase